MCMVVARTAGSSEPGTWQQKAPLWEHFLRVIKGCSCNTYTYTHTHTSCSHIRGSSGRKCPMLGLEVRLAGNALFRVLDAWSTGLFCHGSVGAEYFVIQPTLVPR